MRTFQTELKLPQSYQQNYFQKTDCVSEFSVTGCLVPNVVPYRVSGYGTLALVVFSMPDTDSTCMNE